MKAVEVILEMNNLLKLQASIQAKAQLLLDKAAFDIENSAKQLAPVDTGALRSSIYVSGASGGSDYSSMKAESEQKGAAGGRIIQFNSEYKPSDPWERIIAVSVIYGIFPEVRGHPYLAPAVEMHRARLVRAWSQLFTMVG